MDVAQFRAELALAFEEAGFERRTILRSKDPKWVLPGRQIERSFWQHAIRRPWGFLLSGTLSIDVPTFRTWLASKFPPEQHGIMRDSIFNRHIANEPDMFFGAEDESPPYQEWVDLIRSRLAALPDTIPGLLDARHQPERLRFLWDKWTAPKSFSYFEAWATGDAPCAAPPFRQPDGQIIDSSANRFELKFIA